MRTWPTEDKGKECSRQTEQLMPLWADNKVSKFEIRIPKMAKVGRMAG